MPEPDLKTAPGMPVVSGNREPRILSSVGPVTAATTNSCASASCSRIRLVSVPADSEAYATARRRRSSRSRNAARAASAPADIRPSKSGPATTGILPAVYMPRITICSTGVFAARACSSTFLRAPGTARPRPSPVQTSIRVYRSPVLRNTVFARPT